MNPMKRLTDKKTIRKRILQSLPIALAAIVVVIYGLSFLPRSAVRMRRAPSKLKGFVTTATVRMPSSLAISAMTGAAPVPVPPPMPAVMKRRFAPRIASAICSRFSSAAAAPISGRAPAPRPVLPS